MESKTKIAKRLERKTNPLLRELIVLLKKQKKGMWVRVADLLSRPRMYVVNLEKLEKLSKEGEKIVVPGKILAAGALKHSIKLAAFSISQSALSKLKKSKSQFITIQEMLKQSPEGIIKIII